MSLFDAGEESEPPRGPAAGGADAARHAGRVRRPAAFPRRREAAAPAAGGRPPGLGDLLRSAGHAARPRWPGCWPRRAAAISSRLSAVASGVKELREILAEAHDRLSASGQKTLLFIDEIHRFNKAQQDVLLPGVEEGVVILVGATTENPFFTINSALVSRSRIFQFEPLSNEDIKTLLRRAVADPERGLGRRQIHLARRRPGVPGRDQRRRRPAGAVGAGGRRALQRRRGRWSSPASWPKSRCSGRRCNTTARATPITTPSAR